MESSVANDDLVMELVDAALARPVGQREEFLRSMAGADTAVFAEAWEMVSWEERMGGFLTKPLIALEPVAPFEVGDLVEGRFRIDRVAGEGGMGLVYDAFDTKLNKRIAIKCPKLGFQRRLPPEASLALRVTHPNVCRVYELHSTNTDHGLVEFITMEYVEGETLAARLSREGAPPRAEAELLAGQLCDALAAAHEHGVIHRDLKAANVLLRPRGGPLSDGGVDAVITDFGLALGDDVSAAGATNSLWGTPQYVAPELWKGVSASAVSDIYALGVILHELATGKPPAEPFQAPPMWGAAIRRCLDADPSKRFAAARDLGRAITPKPSRRRLWIAAAVAAGVAGLAAFPSLRERYFPPITVSLVVVPFRVAGGTPEQQAAVDRASRAVAERLAHYKGRGFEMARPGSTPTHVLRADMMPEGKLLRGRVQLQASGGATVRTTTALYAPDALAPLQADAVRMAGLEFRLRPQLAREQLTGEAKELYESGRKQFARGLVGFGQAEDLFRRALSVAPSSALVRAAIVECLVRKGPREREEAKQLVGEAEWIDPGSTRVRSALGHVFSLTGRVPEAIGVLEFAAAEDPGPDVLVQLSSALRRNGNLERALRMGRQAVGLDPSDVGARMNLGLMLQRSGRADEAIHEYRAATSRAPEMAEAFGELGNALGSAGNLIEAEVALRRAVQLHETPTKVLNLGNLLSDGGRDSEAATYFERALKLGRTDYFTMLSLGDAYRRLGRAREAHRCYREGLDQARAGLASNPRNAELRSFAGLFLAWLGSSEQAQSELLQAIQNAPDDMKVRRQAIIGYEAMGSRGEALSLLVGVPSGFLNDLSREPDLKKLRSDPHYRDLSNAAANRQIH